MTSNKGIVFNWFAVRDCTMEANQDDDSGTVDKKERHDDLGKFNNTQSSAQTTVAVYIQNEK